MGEQTRTFIAMTREFGLDPDDLRSSLNGLPPFELWIQFGEAMAFFESNDDEFTEAEAAVIRELDDFIAALPPEPDGHWKEESLDNPLWAETRKRVRRAIGQLEDLGGRDEENR